MELVNVFLYFSPYTPTDPSFTFLMFLIKLVFMELVNVFSYFSFYKQIDSKCNDKILKKYQNQKWQAETYWFIDMT